MFNNSTIYIEVPGWISFSFALFQTRCAHGSEDGVRMTQPRRHAACTVRVYIVIIDHRDPERDSQQTAAERTPSARVPMCEVTGRVKGKLSDWPLVNRWLHALICHSWSLISIHRLQLFIDGLREEGETEGWKDVWWRGRGRWLIARNGRCRRSTRKKSRQREADGQRRS